MSLNYENYIPCQKVNRDLDTYCKRYSCDGAILRPDKYVYDLINYENSNNLEEIVIKVLENLEDKISL